MKDKGEHAESGHQTKIQQSKGLVRTNEQYTFSSII